MSPAVRRATVALLLLAAACTSHHYPGPVLPPEQLAPIDVGNAVVREIDGERRRGGMFDVSRFEVTPGPHRLRLVFELPARRVGMKMVPAQAGEGVCVLEFTAEARKLYYLGSRPRSETIPRWNGAWEGWVRDPSVTSEDDVIARCASQVLEVAAAPTAVTTPAPPPPLAGAPAAPPAVVVAPAHPPAEAAPAPAPVAPPPVAPVIAQPAPVVAAAPTPTAAAVVAATPAAAPPLIRLGE
jgi:hypothetical protein